MRGWFEEGKKKTADSQIVTSVAHAMVALGFGWTAGNGAWKCAAKLGNMEVLNMLLEWSDDAFDLDEWGDGVFAAAAEAGNT